MFDYKMCMPVFGTHAEAVDVLNQMKDIAVRYGFCSMADLMDLANLYSTNHYEFNKYIWTYKELKNARIHTVTGLRYHIDLPEPNFTGKSTKHHEEPNSPTPGILNITIMTNELESPGTYISDIFTQISKVKDRMINITIM